MGDLQRVLLHLQQRLQPEVINNETGIGIFYDYIENITSSTSLSSSSERWIRLVYSAQRAAFFLKLLQVARAVSYSRRARSRLSRRI